MTQLQDQVYRKLKKDIKFFRVFRRRGWIGSSECTFRGDQEETLNHLLVHCHFTKEIWAISSHLCKLEHKPIGLLQQGKSTKDWHWGSCGPFGLLKIRTTFRTKSRTSTRFSIGWRPAESHQALTDPSFIQSMTPLYHAAILMGHLNFKGSQDSVGLESGPFFQQERDYLLSWDLAKPSTTDQNSLQLAVCLEFLGWLASKL